MASRKVPHTCACLLPIERMQNRMHRKIHTVYAESLALAEIQYFVSKVPSGETSGGIALRSTRRAESGNLSTMSRSLAVSDLEAFYFVAAIYGEPRKPANFCLLPTQRRIYSDVFAKWPKQDLRPDYQFQDVLGKVVDERFKTYKPSIEPEELLKARALQFLVQNKFRDRVRNHRLSRAFCKGPANFANKGVLLVQAQGPNAGTQEPADVFRGSGQGN